MIIKFLFVFYLFFFSVVDLYIKDFIYFIVKEGYMEAVLLRIYYRYRWV